MLYKKNNTSYEEAKAEMRSVASLHKQLFIDFFTPLASQALFNPCPYKTAYNLGKHDAIKKIMKLID